ncbi:MAG: hypothetical protein M3N05_04365 [Pseudomonadota bacterium]|nr:hypothetical protein [Pseudomonadota bacterium]
MNTDLEDFPAYIPIDPRSPAPDFRPGAVWTQARADYLAGESAPRVCQRYELALSTFRTRMRVEGWRRCDQKDEEVEPRELDPAPPTPELVDQAWRAMADALKRGRAYEARTFLRLVQDLRAEVSREEAIVQHQARKAAQAGTLDPALHGLHSGSHSANPSDIDAAEADLPDVGAEADRLQALARSGKAGKAELVMLHTLRTTLRQHRTVCDALRAVDRAMAG